MGTTLAGVFLQLEKSGTVWFDNVSIRSLQSGECITVEYIEDEANPHSRIYYKSQSGRPQVVFKVIGKAYSPNVKYTVKTTIFTCSFWKTEKMVFQGSGSMSDKGTGRVVIPLDSLEPDDYQLDVKIYTADSEVMLGEGTFRFSVFKNKAKGTPPLPRVDGNPFFPLGVYSVTELFYHDKETLDATSLEDVLAGKLSTSPADTPELEQTVRWLKDIGVNCLTCYCIFARGGYTDEDLLKSMKIYLDRAAMYDLKVYLYTLNEPSLAFLNNPDDMDAVGRITRQVKMFKDHPALAFWGREEDFEHNRATPATIHALRKLVESLDPDHPFLYGTAASDRASLKEMPPGDAVIWWNYLEEFVNAHRRIRYARSVNQRVLQLWDYNVSAQTANILYCGGAYDPPTSSRFGRFPDAHEHLCSAMIEILTGSRGLWWWALHTSKRAGLMDTKGLGHPQARKEYGRAMRFLKDFVPIVTAGTYLPEPVTGLPRGFISRAWRCNDVTYLAVVNPWYQPTIINCRLNDFCGTITDIHTLDPQEKRPDVIDGMLRDTFDRYQVKVYVLSAANPEVPSSCTGRKANMMNQLHDADDDVLPHDDFHVDSPSRVLDVSGDPQSTWVVALRKGNDHDAIKAYVAHLRNKTCFFDRTRGVVSIYRDWFDKDIAHTGGHDYNPDDVVNLRYTGAYGLTHQFHDDIDWFHDPTNGKSIQWQIQLNRHYHWISLADAYEQNHNSVYAQAFERELRSWMAQCPPKYTPPGTGTSAWQTIEVAIRAGWTWPYALEVFRTSEHVSDQALWYMVCGLHAHAEHLMTYRWQFNWLVMETNGLAHVAMLLPELHNTAEYLKEVSKRVSLILRTQFLHDGCHIELAPDYAASTVIANLYALSNLGDYPNILVNRELSTTLADAAHSLACIAAKNGYTPALHDSPPTYISAMHQTLCPDRPSPWQANGYDMLPWGGYFVSRHNGRTLLFDAGPFGANHQHYDSLQILLHDGSQWILADPGKPHYNASELTWHIRSSEGHNVVLPDGRHRQDYPRVFIPYQPMCCSVWTHDTVTLASAVRQYTVLDNNGQQIDTFFHGRYVLDARDTGIAVIDILEGTPGESYAWEWLWHTEADHVNTEHTYAQAGKWIGSCTATTPVEWSHACGQEHPQLRGWRASDVHSKVPMNVFRCRTQGVAGKVVAATWWRNGDGDEIDMPELIVSQGTIRINLPNATSLLHLKVSMNPDYSINSASTARDKDKWTDMDRAKI